MTLYSINTTNHPILVGPDKSLFSKLCHLYSNKMNGAGTNKDEAIIVDEVISGNSGPVVPTPAAAARSSPVPPISHEERQRALKTQEAMLAHYKSNMDKKPAAKQVTPENKKRESCRRQRAGQGAEEGRSGDSYYNCRNKNGEG